MTADHRLLVDIARAFYLQDRSKTQIADEMGLSRFKVARLLERARDEGVVRITIDDGVDRQADVAGRLRDHLALDDATVVPSLDDEEQGRLALARAAAAEIRATVRPGDVFGFSWGRTLARIGEFLDGLPPSTLVALTGSVGSDFEQSPVQVLRTVSRGSQTRTMSIFAPLLVGSEELATALRRDPAIAPVLRTYEELALAVVSVGSWEPRITQLTDALTDEDRAELDAEGARAEMVGIFLRDDGTPIEAALTRRRVSIRADQLVRVPHVLAVAGGLAKVPALLAVARSRTVTSLVTDERTAEALLAQPAVPPGPRRLPTAEPVA